jgi:hypothetical protein
MPPGSAPGLIEDIRQIISEPVRKRLEPQRRCSVRGFSRTPLIGQSPDYYGAQQRQVGECSSYNGGSGPLGLAPTRQSIPLLCAPSIPRQSQLPDSARWPVERWLARAMPRLLGFRMRQEPDRLRIMADRFLGWPRLSGEAQIIMRLIGVRAEAAALPYSGRGLLLRFWAARARPGCCEPPHCPD